MRKYIIFTFFIIIFALALKWILTPTTSERWANSPSAIGLLNMDDISKSFRNTSKINDFEKKINRISESENLIIIELEKLASGFELIGWEDLNNNKNIDYNIDEKLFKITTFSDHAIIKGLGVNSSFQQEIRPYPNTIHYANRSSTSYFGGYHRYGTSRYYTSYRFLNTDVTNDRDSHRRSNEYTSQLNSNNNFINNNGDTGSSSLKSQKRTAYIRRKSNDPRFIRKLNSKTSNSVFTKRMSLNTPSPRPSSSRTSSRFSGSFFRSSGSQV